MARAAMRLIIQGRVQGVGYRWWAVGQARALGLDGWVRNRRDGPVELLAIGEPGSLDALAAACRDGPPAARVSAVSRSAAEDDGSAGFDERPTLWTAVGTVLILAGVALALTYNKKGRQVAAPTVTTSRP